MAQIDTIKPQVVLPDTELPYCKMGSAVAKSLGEEQAVATNPMLQNWNCVGLLEATLSDTLEFT